MKALKETQVTAAEGSLLTKAEISALMARRDLIVAFFQRQATDKGAENVLFS